MASYNIDYIYKVLLLIGALASLLLFVYKYLWPAVYKYFMNKWNTFQLNDIQKNINATDRRNILLYLDKCNDIISNATKLKLSNQLEDAMQYEKYFRYRLRYKVQFFPFYGSESIECHYCDFLLKQNNIQPLFQFEIGNLNLHYTYVDVEKRLESIDPKQKPKPFIESVEGVMAEVAGLPLLPSPLDIPITVIITKARLPRKNFLWGHFEGDIRRHDQPWGNFPPNRFWVLSLANLTEVLPDIPVEKFVLRMLQRACVNSILPVRPAWRQRQNLPDRFSHNNNYGCLFDYAVLLAHARYFVTNDYICDDCASEILKANKTEIPFGHRLEFLNTLQKWLSDT
jgi:hypothetical protein